MRKKILKIGLILLITVPVVLWGVVRLTDMYKESQKDEVQTQKTTAPSSQPFQDMEPSIIDELEIPQKLQIQLEPKVIINDYDAYELEEEPGIEALVDEYNEEGNIGFTFNPRQYIHVRASLESQSVMSFQDELNENENYIFAPHTQLYYTVEFPGLIGASIEEVQAAFTVEVSDSDDEENAFLNMDFINPENWDFDPNTGRLTLSIETSDKRGVTSGVQLGFKGKKFKSLQIGVEKEF